MTRSLPPRASLEHLRNEAKSLLEAHKARDSGVCETLERLHRLARMSEPEILGTPVKLQECQHALALEYGFRSWAGLKEQIESRDKAETEEREKWAEVVPGQVRPESLAQFALRNMDLPEDIPYLGGGVPSAIVQILRHSGETTDFAEVAAACGWAFSFGYAYNDVHVAALAVDHFAFLPERLGYDRERVSCSDRDAVWDIVKRSVDRETPLVCTMLDGGLVYGYRVNDGKREMWFDGIPVMGWTDIEMPHPLDTCEAFVKQREPQPREAIMREALERVASPATRSQAALETYAADVEDPEKDFADAGEWFCWATFERLSARWCCAQWLRRAADVVAEAQVHLLAAANQYDKAFSQYERYRLAVDAGVPTELSPHERARIPERIATIAPILRDAIAAEAEGVEELERAAGMVS